MKSIEEKVDAKLNELVYITEDCRIPRQDAIKAIQDCFSVQPSVWESVRNLSAVVTPTLVVVFFILGRILA
jgi:hypothetical protein